MSSISSSETIVSSTSRANDQASTSLAVAYVRALIVPLNVGMRSAGLARNSSSMTLARAPRHTSMMSWERMPSPTRIAFLRIPSIPPRVSKSTRAVPSSASAL